MGGGALAHAGDQRAAAPLADLLGQATFPWTRPPQRTFARDDGPSQPDHLIDALGASSATLLGPVIACLDRRDGRLRVVNDLVRGLGRWGPAAAPAVPALTAELTQHCGNHCGFHCDQHCGTDCHRDCTPRCDKHQDWHDRDRDCDRHCVDLQIIATTLAGIGTAAAPAAPTLRTAAAGHTRDAAVLTWAAWRVSGQQAAETAETLTRLAATPPHGPRSLRLLADLGPAAAEASSATIRALLHDRDEWIRVHAAHALWRVTGDRDQALPVLLETVARTNPAHAQAYQVQVFEYLGEIGPPAAAAIPVIEAFLLGDRTDLDLPPHDRISTDARWQQLAARALASIRHLPPP